MLYVVPEPSLRWMTVIWALGRFAPLLTFTSRGSFQRVILPRKMSARIEPVRWRRFVTPSRWYGIEVADNAHGICTQPRQAANWSGVSGASEAPKSTVRFVIALIPPPDPIGPYVTLILRSLWIFGIHVLTSFETNVLPAPVRLESARFELDAPAAATTASAITPSSASESVSFL